MNLCGNRRWIRFLPLVVAIFLTACKTELYSGLVETEGNEMLALLLSSGVDTEKTTDKKGLVTLLTEASDIAVAVEILTNAGYPKNKFETFGDIYKQEGLVFSPLQEKARYIYALSQEISGTLAKIDGVLIARVHVVLAEEEHPGKITVPASASVFIKHVPEVSLDHLIPRIKSIVANGVEALTYERVSVALFSATEKSVDRSLLPEKVLFLRVAPDSVTTFYIVFITMLFLIIVLAVSTGLMVLYFGNDAKSLVMKKLFPKKPEKEDKEAAEKAEGTKSKTVGRQKATS